MPSVASRCIGNAGAQPQPHPNPKRLQALYERVCQYLELGARLDLLDARFLVGEAQPAGWPARTFCGVVVMVVMMWLVVSWGAVPVAR